MKHLVREDREMESGIPIRWVVFRGHVPSCSVFLSRWKQFCGPTQLSPCLKTALGGWVFCRCRQMLPEICREFRQTSFQLDRISRRERERERGRESSEESWSMGSIQAILWPEKFTIQVIWDFQPLSLVLSPVSDEVVPTPIFRQCSI